MKIDVDGLEVIFPYDYIYPEQYRYMFALKRFLQVGGTCLLEMPSGTGKTVCLLSLTIAFILKNAASYTKILYLTRTVSEMEKVMEETKNLYDYYKKSEGKSLELLSICLTSRKNLCLNREVLGDSLKLVTGKFVDMKCHTLTAPSLKAQNKLTKKCTSHINNPDVESQPGCEYFEKFNIEGFEYVLPYGVYAIDDLKCVGEKNNWCPYFLARHAIHTCQILVYSYYYLLDPKVAQVVSREISSQSIVVFDEAHNIDSACIESFTVKLTVRTILDAKESLNSIKNSLNELKLTDANKLAQEYSEMLKSVRKRIDENKNDLYLTNPIIPQVLLEELVPGSIRKAEHFIGFLNRFVQYIEHRMNYKNVCTDLPILFLKDLYDKVRIDHRPLRMCSERLRSLLNTLELDTDSNISSSLSKIVDFATILGTYQNGFCILSEPYDQSTPTIPNPKITLVCMDANLAIKPVQIHNNYKRNPFTTRHVSKAIEFSSCGCFEFFNVISETKSFPLIVSKGSDQSILSSRFADRENISIIRNYGSLVTEICSVVPDGVVCFFTSYRHMESFLAAWEEMGILAKIQQNKLVFAETPNIYETTLALNAFRDACKVGRGACLMSIARGKVSEGIDFHGLYGRAVILIGVPYVFTLSHSLRARLDYLRERYDIKESDFLTFDAMRHAAQCLGRVIRGKNDYGIMILADQRFARADRIKRLPKWIKEYLPAQNIGVSVDDAVNMSRRFLRQMGQPLDVERQMGVSMLTPDMIKSEKFQKSLQLSLVTESAYGIL